VTTGPPDPMRDAPGSPEYLAEHIRTALATDPRVHEQGLDVTVIGHTVVLRGTVTTPTRRRALAEVAHELAPGAEILNDVEVPPNPEPEAPEEIG
jgi:osmotically-inducible protein OsmY